MRTDRLLLLIALLFLAVTLFLAGLSIQETDLPLRFDTMLYATYIFVTGIAVLVLVEIVHLAKREISKRHST